MKPNKDETLESWINRAKMYEQGIALQKLAEGENPEQVFQEFSRRLLEKIMHPIYQDLKDSIIKNYDPEKDRQSYYENYLKKHTPKPDHIEDEKFDKND